MSEKQHCAIDLRGKYRKGEKLRVTNKFSNEVFECEWLDEVDWLIGCPLVKRLSDGKVIDVGYHHELVEAK